MPVVGWPTIIGYGAGDFGLNLYFTGLNLYLLYYYTDVLGIHPATAGLIFMLPVIWDGLSDPLMGWLATRTRTSLGRFRPYIVFASPLVGVSFVGMFAAPLWFSDHVFVACLVSHLLFRTLYTVVSVPYSSLAAVLTQDSQARGTMAGVRIFAAMGGGLLTAASMLTLATALGEGNVQLGFVYVSLIYAGLATLMMAVVFFSTREAPVSKDEPRLSTRQTLLFLSRNHAFWILCSASFLGVIGATMGGKAFVYYINYYAGQPEAVSQIMAIGIAGAGLAIPIWTWIARRLGKRSVWMISGIGVAAVNFFLYVGDVRDVLTLSILAGANGLIGGAVAVMFWSMLPDTVEYGQWHSRVRDEGIVFGLSQLISKSASGVGVGMLGLILGAVGYTANEAQSENALQMIRSLSFGLPALTSALAALMIWFYPLDTALHARLVAALARRESKLHAQSKGSNPQRHSHQI